MDRHQLNTLLSNFAASSSHDAENIVVLSKKYPYSQVLHTLAAKAAKDHQLTDKQELLQLAAVYSTDRSILKEVILTTFKQSSSKHLSKNSIPISTETKPAFKTDQVDYADEIIQDLARLKELRESFEMQFMSETKEPAKVESTPVISIAPASEAKLPEAAESKEIQKPKAKRKTSKRQRIIELAKQLETEQQLEKEEKEEKEKQKSKKKTLKSKDDTDPLIDEIKATKKEIEPQNAKTKEQIELIDQYMKSKPVHNHPKISSEEKLDLASTLKSGEFGDNIISETLAEILIRQGKKDKAIEVYKKLIWKFPQKRSYFAAQIEDLRK